MDPSVDQQGVALSVQSPGHPSAQGLRPNWSPPGGQASGDDLDTAPGVIRQGPRREGVSPDGSWGWASVLGWAWGCPAGIVADLLIVGISTVPLGQLLRRCRARSLRPALDAPGVGLASGQAGSWEELLGEPTQLVGESSSSPLK